MLEGEVTLVEDGGETVLHAGDCAAFLKGTGNGHHLINRSSAITDSQGARQPISDWSTCLAECVVPGACKNMVWLAATSSPGRGRDRRLGGLPFQLSLIHI